MQPPQLLLPPAGEIERVHKVSMHSIAEDHRCCPVFRCEATHLKPPMPSPWRPTLGAGEDNASGVGRTISDDVDDGGAGGGHHHPSLLNAMQQQSSCHPPSRRMIPMTPDPQALRRQPSFRSAQVHLLSPPPDDGRASWALLSMSDLFDLFSYLLPYPAVLQICDSKLQPIYLPSSL